MSEAPVRQNWKYEKKIVRCRKCKTEMIVEGDSSSCFSSDSLCTTCAAK